MFSKPAPARPTVEPDLAGMTTALIVETLVQRARYAARIPYHWPKKTTEHALIDELLTELERRDRLAGWKLDG